MPTKRQVTQVPHILPPLLRETLETNYKLSYERSLVHKDHQAQKRRLCLRRMPTQNVNVWRDAIALPKFAVADASGVRRELEAVGSSWLHACVKLGDIAGVYELVRLDHPLDMTETDGSTPLVTACHLLYQNSLSPAHVKRTPTYANKQAALLEMTELLIRHHADVNVKVGDWTPLLYLARAEQWDLCELLLKHGADPASLEGVSAENALPSYLVPRLEFLAKMHYSAARPRPDRLCPCHSGLTLSECHDGQKAWQLQLSWPSYAPCPCFERQRSYADCCEKKGVSYVSYWKGSRLVHDKFQAPNIVNDGSMPLQAFSVLEKFTRLHPGGSLGSQGPTKAMALELIRPYAEKLAAENAIDRAFAHVVAEVGSNLHPDVARERYSAATRKEWNEIAEAYIQSGVDPRPRRELEIASKVNAHGGPMYRVCEGVSCGIREDREGEYKQCGRCRKTAYCSPACQADSWKAHRRVCCTQDQPAQWLPDSITLDKELQLGREANDRELEELMLVPGAEERLDELLELRAAGEPLPDWAADRAPWEPPVKPPGWDEDHSDERAVEVGA